jgi:ELWxxDGT repeat protein
MRLLVGNQIYHTDGMSLQTRLVGEFPSQPQELIGFQDLLIYSADSDHGTVVFATSGESFEVIADTAWRSVSSTIRFVEGPLIILEEGFDRDQYDHPEDFGYQFQGQLFTSDGTTSGTDQITDEPVTLPEMEYCCTYSPTYEHIDGDVYIREWIFGRNRFERVDLDQKSVAVVSDSEELARVNAAYADRLDEMLQRPVYETLEFEGREFRFVGDDDAKYLFTHEHIVGFVGDEVRRVAYDVVGISPPILGHYQQDLGFAHLDGLVYFSAIHADSGRELWRSDGTIAGTELVIDVKPGPDGSDTYVLGSSVDAVFFSANDGVHGQEVWGYTAYQDPDINGDGLLDERDFAILAANFGRAAGDEGGDINEDGIVDFADFLLLSHAIKRDS